MDGCQTGCEMGCFEWNVRGEDAQGLETPMLLVGKFSIWLHLAFPTLDGLKPSNLRHGFAQSLSQSSDLRYVDLIGSPKRHGISESDVP